MKKSKFVVLLLGGLLTLSACSVIFNDDDLAFENVYNPPVETEEPDPDAVTVDGVVGKETETLPNVMVFKNICYATDEKIANTYKEGGVNHTEYNINDGQDFAGNEGNNYDLYVPNAAKKNDKHLVLLFVHGGAWVSGYKTDVNSYVQEFAGRGFITATLKYTLLKEEVDDDTLSIFRDLDEIDACIASIKHSIESLGYDTTKTQFAIGGASSGAHLSMLYSYSRGDKCPLPIKFIVDAVGPVDIKPEAWKCFKNPTDAVLEAGITKDAIAVQSAADNLDTLAIASTIGETKDWNQYETMRIANGMCGLPYTLEEIEETTNEDKENVVYPNAASTSMLKVGGGEDLLSVTHYITSANRIPIICAYGGKDSIVGINQYARLQNALDAAGYTSANHKFFYFKNANHIDLTSNYDEYNGVTVYSDFIAQIDAWCKADSI